MLTAAAANIKHGPGIAGNFALERTKKL